jgi:hypothetical protein
MQANWINIYHTCFRQFLGAEFLYNYFRLHPHSAVEAIEPVACEVVGFLRKTGILAERNEFEIKIYDESNVTNGGAVKVHFPVLHENGMVSIVIHMPEEGQ